MSEGGGAVRHAPIPALLTPEGDGVVARDSNCCTRGHGVSTDILERPDPAPAELVLKVGGYRSLDRCGDGNSGVATAGGGHSIPEYPVRLCGQIDFHAEQQGFASRCQPVIGTVACVGAAELLLDFAARISPLQSLHLRIQTELGKNGDPPAGRCPTAPRGPYGVLLTSSSGTTLR